MRFWFLLSGFVILFCNTSNAQTIPLIPDSRYQAPVVINHIFNRIQNSGGLSPLFYKLNQLKKNKTGVVRIVHIGDSHTQPDFFSGLVRENLQAFFGNAGRGLVFPYQLAKSNTPSDIASGSNVNWEYNRVAHPEINIDPGVSGFVIQTNSLAPTMEMYLKDGGRNDSSNFFNHVRFFVNAGKPASWVLQIPGSQRPYQINNNGDDSSIVKDIYLEKYTTDFSLLSIPGNTTKSFYGVSLENDKPGVIYHTIGVNGARYGQYNIAPIFWKQLLGLSADLYIISLGTNEAQAVNPDVNDFIAQVKLMIDKIKKINSKACILITSAADSYKGNRPNRGLQSLNFALAAFCLQNSIPFWNLYQITNGYGSCYNWYVKGLMNKDRIHFVANGYRIHGYLFFNAFAKAYNAAMVENTY